MSLVSIVMVGVLGLSGPSLWPPHKIFSNASAQKRASYKVSTKTYRLAGWDMRIQRDGFTGEVRCRLYVPAGVRRHAMSYARGTIGLHLDPDQDVAGAWYSIDDRPATAWRDDYPALVARRVALDDGSLVNPTGGVVLVPAEKLVGARTAAVRAERQGAIVRFKLKGFQRALEAARANGCARDDAFERERW